MEIKIAFSRLTNSHILAEVPGSLSPAVCEPLRELPLHCHHKCTHRAESGSLPAGAQLAKHRTAVLLSIFLFTMMQNVQCRKTYRTYIVSDVLLHILGQVTEVTLGNGDVPQMRDHHLMDLIEGEVWLLVKGSAGHAWCTLLRQICKFTIAGTRT